VRVSEVLILYNIYIYIYNIISIIIQLINFNKKVLKLFQILQ